MQTNYLNNLMVKVNIIRWQHLSCRVKHLPRENWPKNQTRNDKFENYDESAENLSCSLYFSVTHLNPFLHGHFCILFKRFIQLLFSRCNLIIYPLSYFPLSLLAHKKQLRRVLYIRKRLNRHFQVKNNNSLTATVSGL